jgi:MFS family permease
MTPAAGSHPKARLFRVLIYGLVLTSSAAQYAIVPVMPVYAHRLDLSGAQQGMVLGATGLAMLAVCLPAGALSDRLGARRLTLCAGLLMAIALFGQSLAGSFPELIGSRLAFGIGYGVMWTAGLSWIAATVPGGSALGGSVACSGFGGVAGPAAWGVLVQYFGLAIPALATAAVFAALTVGLALLRMPASTDTPSAPVAASLRSAIADRRVICTCAAILAVGLTTGVTALLVPAELHAAGASPARIGLAFSVAGILFAVTSSVTASAGKRALRLPVVCGGMLAMAAALLPGSLTSAPLVIVAMLCGATTARAVLWTVSYPLAAEGAQRSGAGLGVVVGLLNGIWAATAVLGPLGAGLGVEHLSPRTVFGVTEAACLAVLGVTIAVAWRAWRPARAQAIQPHLRPAQRGRADHTAGAAPGTLKASRAWRGNAAAEIPHRDTRTEHGRGPRVAASHRGRPRGPRQADRRGGQQLHRVRARARALARGGPGRGRGGAPGGRGAPRVQHDRGR